MTNTINSSGRTAPQKALLAVSAALFSLAFNGNAAIPSPEKLLPRDTLMMMTAPDFSKWCEVYRATPQVQLWNDPAMKPFRDKFLARWKAELVQPLERDLGVRFDDYTSLPQGQVTFAVTQNGWQGTGPSAPGLLFLLDSKNKSDQLKKNLEDLRKKWVDAGKNIKNEKIRGVEFWVLPISTNDVPKTLRKLFPPPEQGFEESDGDAGKDAPKPELVLGQYESLLIVGNSTKAVEPVVAHLTGGSMPALSDLPEFEANRLVLFRDAPFYGWANLKTFIGLLARQSQGRGDPNTPDPLAALNPEKIMAAVGFNGLKTLAFAFHNSSEGSLAQVFVGVPESSRQGIFTILPGEPKDSSPPPFVPADVVKFQRWRLDGQKAWATLKKVMNDINPQLLSGLNFMLESANTAAKEKDPDFDIKKNLIGNLGDDMISYQKAPQGGTLAALNTAPSILLLGSPHAEQLAAALKSILVLWNQQAGSPNEREFLGHKIYSVQLPSAARPASGANSLQPRSLSYAASGGYVALTTDTSILEEYLRSSAANQKSLRERRGLVEATAKVGGANTGWFAYENQAETMRAVFEALRKSSSEETANATAALLPGSAALPFIQKSIKEWLDFSLLPPFDRIAKYFSFTVSAASANPQGMTLKVFSPEPPDLQK